MIRRSKGLVEIDRLPDTQDEGLTYTCCSESEGPANLSISNDAQTREQAQEALAVAFVEMRGATDSLLAAIRQAAAPAGKSSDRSRKDA